MSLLVGEVATDFRKPSLDPFVNNEATANHGTDAGRDLGIQGACVAAGDFDAREIGRTACCNVVTPTAAVGKELLAEVPVRV
jgi:hypothetical protein